MLNKTFQNGSGGEEGAKLMILVGDFFFRPETIEDDGGDIIISVPLLY